MTTVPADESRAAFTAGMRAIADFLDQHPAVPLPYLRTGKGDTGTPHVLCDYIVDEDPRRQLAEIARELASGGNTIHKHASDGTHPRFLVWRQFGSIALAYQADRDQVCERVVVGTETVEAEEDACPQCEGPIRVNADGTTECRDSGPAHYASEPPAKRVAKVEREIVRWECTPLLAGADHA